MSTSDRRSSVPSRPEKENVTAGGKAVAAAAKPQLAKKRPALTNITNQRSSPVNAVRTSVVSKAMVPCEVKIVKLKKGSSVFTNGASISESSLPESVKIKSSSVVSSKDIHCSRLVTPTPSCMEESCHSDGGSVSFDESMTTCDSLKSPKFEYIENDNASAVNFIEWKTCDSLNISDHAGETAPTSSNTTDDVPLEAFLEYQPAFLRRSTLVVSVLVFILLMTCLQTKKMPSTDFMERIQKDINASMRATLIDWLVEVAEEYRLVSDTLFLAVNYIDRYLSGNTINRQRLQLLGVACMMIAAKYEEICAPRVEEFCYITDNTYSRDEVLEMESAVLNYLRFEMTAPTAICFLRHFVQVAQRVHKVPAMQLEFLASYLAELSLLDYSMLRYAPSMIAASATFLAKFILLPSERPWTLTLKHHALYMASDLRDCVKALHRLCCNSQSSCLPAIREKYSQHNYKFVAKKCCPPITAELFHELSSYIVGSSRVTIVPAEAFLLEKVDKYPTQVHTDTHIVTVFRGFLDRHFKIMTTQSRRSSLISSSSSLAKRQSENVGKVMVVPPMAKKRPALANVTNQRPSSNNVARNSANMVPCPVKITNPKKEASTFNNSASFSGNNLPSSSVMKPCTVISSRNVSLPISTVSVPPAPRSVDISPIQSDSSSISMDESMSTCDSLKSPDVEYIDNNDIAAVESIERKTCSKLFISEHVEVSGNICKRDTLADMETSTKIIEVDDNFMDPQLCATMACDIYKHLRASEAKKRPSTDFMERVQKDINTSMRAILVDWLVEVAEEYRLVPDTLYLTVNYIDRYLSGNTMDRQRLQLLGVACMMIAAKYEEICAPQVEEFCYITDNTYFKEEVLQMESAVLNFLKFEMTAPTAKCFLRRFVRAAQGVNEAPSLQLECLANYLAELSLLEYTMLCYTPSLIAASAIFLAKYVLFPSRKPWNPTLRHYTLYQPTDLRECVKALQTLCCDSINSTLPAIREKYSQHKVSLIYLSLD
ncbi:hypothetical protein RJ639_016118 [Escallonia herrerae]|uniref:Cyclin A n=1 Tax=Escallonia herrerae TaxID=1293975 RepID=A0AA88VGD0_9ASTE|nr:hypothetical protein RJ639_016118 [Escallonia herrerae]